MTHLVKMIVRNSSFKRWLRPCTKVDSKRLMTNSINEYFDNGEKEPYANSLIQFEKNPKTRKNYQCLKLPRNNLGKIRSVVGICVTGMTIGWAKIDFAGKRLTDYHSEFVYQQNEDPSENIIPYKRVKSIFKLIPESDLYIMEQVIFNKRNILQFQISVSITAMLSALLNSVEGPLGECNVHFQHPSAVSRRFKLRVNGERVSGGQALRRMINLNEVELYDAAYLESKRTLYLDDTTLKTNNEILRSIASSPPALDHSSAVALFIALGFVSSNQILN